MNEKVSGYSLLISGLLIMVFCVVNIVMVFTNKAKPFSVFNLSSGNFGGNSIPLNINTNQSAPQPKIDILPPEVLNQTLNMTTHFFLMSFILGFGYKLSSLGIQLLRPINVKLRSSPDPPVNKVN